MMALTMRQIEALAAVLRGAVVRGEAVAVELLAIVAEEIGRRKARLAKLQEV